MAITDGLEATGPGPVATAAGRPPHPFIYLLLILPFGVTGGYVAVTLAYLLTQAGVDTVKVAGLIALAVLPNTWKFLWAPVADTTLTRKTWYLVGASLTAAGVLACGLVPTTNASLPLLSVAVFLMSTATTFVAMSTEALMAHHTPGEAKGRAAGWFQAGNLGGAGLGGGAGLWMAQHLPAAWISAAVIGVSCILCALPLLRIAEPPRHVGTAGPQADRSALQMQWTNLVDVLNDVWTLVRSRRGFLALLVVFLPIGTGAASNLWPSSADSWQAGADTVALVNGTLGGMVAIAGSLIGGYFCDRIDRKTAYLLFGVSQAVCVVAMAVAPRTESMFVWFTLLYSGLNGLSYAAFSAVVLETIGLKAAASQYNVYASLSNMPIMYMTVVEGWAYDRGGASAMLYTEAALAVVSIAIFIGVASFTARRHRAMAS